MKLFVATNNPGKQTEFSKILGDLNFELVFPADLAMVDVEVEENGQTFADNALLKAKYFAEKTGMLSVADDSGLEIDFLDGAPGVASKRFFAGTGSDRCQHILQLMGSVTDKIKRRAKFVTVLCLYDPNTKETKFFEGKFAGTIAKESRGKSGFDYDYIFIPNGQTKTVAELGVDYKNEHSHRAFALQQLSTYLKDRK